MKTFESIKLHLSRLLQLRDESDFQSSHEFKLLLFNQFKLKYKTLFSQVTTIQIHTNLDVFLPN